MNRIVTETRFYQTAILQSASFSSIIEKEEKERECYAFAKREKIPSGDYWQLPEGMRAER